MNFNFQKAISLVETKLQDWTDIFFSMLPNLVVAILILIAFFFVAKLVRLLSNRILHKISDKSAINNLFSTLFYISTLGIGLMIALNVMKLEQTVTSLLAGAGIVGLALGFAFQDIAANFISGVLITFRKPIEVNDIIQTQEYMGKVEKIDLRVTVIRTFQGLHVIIPNRDIFQKPVTNYTKTQDRRIDIKLGVSYDDDLGKVKKVAIQAVQSMDYLLEGKEIGFYYSEFGDSSINFVVMLWINYPDEPGYLTAKSEAIMLIKKAFDKNDITIPFPIRTLNINSKSNTSKDREGSNPQEGLA